MYKPRRRNKAPEQAIKNLILKWFTYYPRYGFVWPNASVGVWDREKQCYRKNKSIFHINGVSDIIGIWMGKPLFIEVKSKTGVVSDDQKKFLARAKAHEAIVILARSLEDVTRVLEPMIPQAISTSHIPSDASLCLHNPSSE